jgi:hypothetical protein
VVGGHLLRRIEERALGKRDIAAWVMKMIDRIKTKGEREDGVGLRKYRVMETGEGGILVMVSMREWVINIVHAKRIYPRNIRMRSLTTGFVYTSLICRC